MLDRLTANLDFYGKALVLRADRQRALSSNIANADTPGYQARDMDFAGALAQATGTSRTVASSGTLQSGAGGATGSAGASMLKTDARHLGAGAAGGVGSVGGLLYRTPEQASGDGNSVDMDRERANFADNAVRYEATLRFINGGVRQALSAIRGE